MNYLALDIGLKRTGVAFADDTIGVPLSLETLQHNGIEELIEPVCTLIDSRKIDHLVVGLPKLPSGDEGEQCEVVRTFVEKLQPSIPFSFVDERFTSFGSHTDADASAATQVLLTFLDQSA